MSIFAALGSIAKGLLGPGHEEIVTVHANGFKYLGWKKVTVKGSIKEAARSFTLECTERSLVFSDDFKFPPGTKIQIKSNGDLLLDGYVDDYKPQISPEEHPVVISGRGRGADFIDSAAEHATGYEEDKTPLDLGQKLAQKFGISITASKKMAKVPYMQIDPGSSAFRNFERYARQQGFVLMGKANGDIEAVKAGEKRHSGSLFEGGNIIDGSATLSQKNRHSEYRVQGSARGGVKPKDLRSQDKSKDPSVQRYRPKISLYEGDTNRGRNKNRAETEKNRRAGEGTKAQITVQGFRDEGGKVFEPSYLIYTASKALKLDQDMTIESFEFEQSSEGGALAKLSLVDPRAYGGKKPGTSKSSGAWAASYSESDPVGVGEGYL